MSSSSNFLTFYKTYENKEQLFTRVPARVFCVWTGWISPQIVLTDDMRRPLLLVSLSLAGKRVCLSRHLHSSLTKSRCIRSQELRERKEEQKKKKKGRAAQESRARLWNNCISSSKLVWNLRGCVPFCARTTEWRGAFTPPARLGNLASHY